MQFEFIRGNQGSPRKTANLSSSPRDRLVPMRDLASLFGCSEPEIARWAECMSIPQESLDWRGSQLACLSLQDAFRLHLAMRAIAEDSTEGTDARSRELHQSLNLKDQALQQARSELSALESRVEQRDSEFETLMEGVGELEKTVAERAGVRRELAELQKLYVESQAKQSELVVKWSEEKKARGELQAAQAEAQERLQELEQHLASAEAAKRQAEQSALEIKAQAQESEARLTQNLAIAEERMAKAQTAARDAQPDPSVVAHGKNARLLTSNRLHRLRASCKTATVVELSLQRYCNRLEAKLRDQ